MIVTYAVHSNVFNVGIVFLEGVVPGQQAQGGHGDIVFYTQPESVAVLIQSPCDFNA